MNPPAGVVTFLFTDIEGSTRLWEADADAMRAALAAHDLLLRETVEAQRGWLFKHTGDGICAAFAYPRAAVDAAAAAQRALELPVRMGIATGEAEARDGDYFGAVVNRAARVMAAGHGGQILVDGAAAILLGDDNLIGLGTRRLRGIAKPIEMFQVSAPGLRAEFPALNTAESTLGNLRTPATSLVGRELELADLATMLKSHRLVTLTGVGGVGKTRLALELAARAADEFPDAVWVIELAPVSDPAAVPEAVAAVLGVTQQPGMSVADSVAAALEGRSRLLVFDNCEHVLDAAADMIESIFAHSTTVKILATSREGLRLPDEQLWPVPPLEINSSAATLFVARASGVAPSTALSDDDHTIAEICRRLDGIPLAIELAASRMQSMTATELRDRLYDRFRLLVGSRRGLERHQTLRHAVQWSYDLLGDAEKALLARCSVFAGGFDLAGARAVAGSGDELTTIDLLDSLVRKSLLVTDHSSERTRFSMLETIRQFAEEQLVVSGGADLARTGHARYFAGLESDVLALWDSPRQRDAYDWFTLEMANLRAAFRWAADHGDLETAAAVAGYATLFGWCVEQYEPIAWAEELIRPAQAVQHPRLARLYVAAALCDVTGRFDDYFGYAEAALAAIESDRFDDVRDVCECAAAAGYLWTGRPQRCIEWCHSAIARHPGSHAYAQTNLVLGLVFLGANDEADAASEKLLAIAQGTDNPNLASFALLAYGWARRDSDPAAAYRALRQALSIAQESGNRQIESSVSFILSRLAVTHGELADATDLLSLAVHHYYDSGGFWYMRGPLAILITLLAWQGLHEPAATISGFATTAVAPMVFPEFIAAIARLREVLGDETFESLARAGAGMTPAAMATYAFDQLDRVRAEVP